MILVLQTIIALVAIIALFSIANSFLLDGARRWFDARGKKLTRALEDLLDPVGEGSDTLLNDFFNHAFIDKLKKATGKEKLSRIDPPLFSEVFIQIISEKGGAKKTDYADPNKLLSRFESGVQSMDEEMQRPLFQLLAYARDSSGDKLKILQGSIATWYESYMKVVSEKFRNKSRVILFYTGCLFAILFNLDMIQIATELVRDDELRITYYNVGEQLGQNDVHVNGEEITGYITKNLANLNADELMEVVSDNITVGADSTHALVVKGRSQLPIGWTITDGGIVDLPVTGKDWFFKIIGMLAMAGALAFGAPFWFDALKRLSGVNKLF